MKVSPCSYLAIFTAITLTGCSTYEPLTQANEQFCHLSTKTIITKDASGQIVDSKTQDVMRCNDDRLSHLLQPRIGMAPTCGVYTYWTQIGGRNVQRKGISCQRPDGGWEVVPVPGY